MILQCDGPNLLGLVHCPKSRAAFSLAEAFSLALALLFAADFFGGAEAAEIGADRSMEGGSAARAGGAGDSGLVCSCAAACGTGEYESKTKIAHLALDCFPGKVEPL